MFDRDELGIDPELDDEECCPECGQPLDECDCDDEDQEEE